MSLFMLTGYGLAASVAYHLFPMRVRWVVLLLLSYGFFASRALSALPFILITTFTTWLGALVIGRIAQGAKARIQAQKASLTAEEKKDIRAKAKCRQRALFYLVLVLNFAILAVLKYTDDVRGWFGASELGLLLPLGISFYTFQSMGYLIDVYNDKYAPEKNPLKFALFVSFFPQLIQGPIGRYDQLAPQLTKAHRFDFENAERGTMLIVWGLFKKLVIADRAFPFVEAVFSAQPGEYGGAIIVLAVLMYSLQQYCDFSGGIELVAGIAELFGVQLAPNFKRPYFAVSLGDFWRRWHISLGSWMRDYVFYPFALTKPMNKLSKAAKARWGQDVGRTLPAAFGNILVFLLVGLWHGATSNYIFWGLYNGLILAFSALAEPAYKRWNAAHAELSGSKGFHAVRVLRTFIIVNIGWYFDRCLHGLDAFRMLGITMTSPRFGEVTVDALHQLGLPLLDLRILAVCTALLFGVSVAQERGFAVREWVQKRILPVRWAVLIFGIMAVLLMGVWGSGFNEASFIYYQF